MNEKNNRVEVAGPFLRDIVFGVHDALLTNIGIVTGFVVALQDNRTIILAALIDVIISAFAMAFGTYLSRTSESEYLKGQMEKATQVDLAKNLAHPVTASVVMWVTYIVAGLIPLSPFLFGLPPEQSVWYAVSLSLVVFFAVGLLKGVLTKTNLWKSGLQFLAFGTVAAFIGYVIGYFGQAILR